MGRVRPSAWVGLFTLCFLACGGPAHAGKSLPIPCLGESVVKVLDIPATHRAPAASNTAPNNPGTLRNLDLGYKFSHCFWGEWVGYTGDSHHYANLTPDRLHQLLHAAGRTEPPSEPHYLAYPLESWRVWFWLAILGFFGARMAWTRWKSAPSAAKPSKSAPYSGPNYWSPEAIAARQRELSGYTREPAASSLPAAAVAAPSAAVSSADRPTLARATPPPPETIRPAPLAPASPPVASSPTLPGRPARVLGAARPTMAPSEPAPRPSIAPADAPYVSPPPAAVSTRPPRIFGKRFAA